MVSIRLSRVGKKNHASYRFVVSDRRKDLYGPALEILGTYDPHVNPPAVAVKGDRVQFWLGKGAKPSATAHNLLVTAGVLKAEKVVVAKGPKKEEPKVEAKAEAPAATPKEESKVETPKTEAQPAEAPKAEAKKEEAPAA